MTARKCPRLAACADLVSRGPVGKALERKLPGGGGERKSPGAVKRNGRHEETRTPDLYRVNSEVNNLKSFACLAFPQTTYLKTPAKQSIFGDELVTSFSVPVGGRRWAWT